MCNSDNNTLKSVPKRLPIRVSFFLAPSLCPVRLDVLGQPTADARSWSNFTTDGPTSFRGIKFDTVLTCKAEHVRCRKPPFTFGTANSYRTSPHKTLFSTVLGVLFLPCSGKPEMLGLQTFRRVETFDTVFLLLLFHTWQHIYSPSHLEG